MTDSERRRYFRIEDNVGVEYELLGEAEAAEKAREIQLQDQHMSNRLQQTERHLQLLIDKLRVQTPEFAEAVELLNTKINLIKVELAADHIGPGRHRGPEFQMVSISACGISFDVHESVSVGDKMYLDLTLFPTDLHVVTMGEVVDRRQSDNEPGHWTVAVDFYGMPDDQEELLVQHVVKRQQRMLAARRKD